MTHAYLYLAVAIAAEVTATSFLKASAGFTKWLPSLVTVAGYCVSFYFLSLTLAFIPTGIAYAIWSGIGIVLISLLGWIFFGQALDAAAIAGMGLIIAGVAVIHLFSKSAAH